MMVICQKNSKQRGIFFSQRRKKNNNFFMKRHLLHNIHINATKMKKKLKPKLKFILPPTEGVGGRGGEF
jgi:hypothetical protein